MRIDKNSKRFDCVEMKRRIQEQIYEETKGMSTEEIVAYFHQRVEKGPFGDLWMKGALKPTHAASRLSTG
jgi:hypothetical protein